MTEAAALAAAAGVGFGHAVLPDHWVPLAVLGRTRSYPLRRVARLSALAGVTHVAVSILLGALLVLVGLQFRSTVEHVQDAVVGGLLLATGLVFIALELWGGGHGHPHGRPHGHAHDDPHGHGHGHTQPHVHLDDDPGSRRLLSVIVPFGAAASPDLTILPVFLAAGAAGTGAALGSLAAFAAVTVATIVTLTVIAAAGGYQVRGGWLQRWGNAFTATVLIVIGALVAAGVL